MSSRGDISNRVDWITIMLYFMLVGFGWVNIYSTVYSPENPIDILSFNIYYGKQLVWIATSIILIIAILTIDYRFYETFAYIIFGVIVFMLVFVLFFGTEVSGSKSWFEIFGIRLQPAEFAKFTVALSIAKFLGDKSKPITTLKDYAIVGAFMAIPALLIIKQGDTGSALVFAAFILVLYREGLPSFVLIVGVLFVALFILTLIYDKLYIFIGIGVLTLIIVGFVRKHKKSIILVLASGVLACGVVFGVNFFVYKVLKPYQQNRIKVLVNPDSDPTGAGWQVTQAKIAIGSGGFSGKGFQNGTQTKFDFIPDHHTDNIFCTIGEEYGFIGSIFLIITFLALFVRIVTLAERQKSKFSRVYGYSVASILFFHFAVNIGMTIGLAPVVGIPLPFISYGGSALWSFTILLFIFLKLDAHKDQILTR